MDVKKEDLQVLENKLNRLKLDYERYFAGVLKKEPLAFLDEVSRLILHCSRRSIQNTSLQYKFNALAASFNSYKQLWNRHLRDRDRIDFEKEHFVERLGGGGESFLSLDEKKLKSTYLEFLEARRKCKEPVDNITYEKVLSLLVDRIRKLGKKGKFTSVDLSVEIKDGRAKIGIKPQKP